jgi:hypothetical protein
MVSERLRSFGQRQVTSREWIWPCSRMPWGMPWGIPPDAVSEGDVQGSARFDVHTGRWTLLRAPTRKFLLLRKAVHEDTSVVQ